jgi:hypothetical protein
MDKTKCTHECCKDAAIPPSAGSPDIDPLRLELEYGEEGKKDDGDPEEPEDTADHGSEFAATLATTLATALATHLPSNSKASDNLAAEFMKYNMKAVVATNFAETDVHDLDKVATYLRSIEKFQIGDNYYQCAKMLVNSFPDNDIHIMCDMAIRELIDNNNKQLEEMPEHVWHDLCRAIINK